MDVPEPEELEVIPEKLRSWISCMKIRMSLVVNKPRGMVVHPAPGHTTGTLVNGLCIIAKIYPALMESFARNCSPHR